MIIEPEISGLSIVAVGDLTPRQFLPDFFRRYDLLTENELNAIDIQLVHADLVQWKTDWFQLQVERNRIVFLTTQAPLVRLRDLVARMFKDVVPSTPLTMLGLNREVHFKVASSGIRDRIGKTLAPPSAWGEWGRKLDGNDEKTHGGLSTLQMIQRDLDDGRPSGFVQVTVQPSMRIVLPAIGVYVQVNDHYEIADTTKPEGSEAVTGFLEANFELSVERSEAIIDQVMKLEVARFV